jgi:hypothetical protein
MRLVVSVDGPSGRHDLSVPDDARLEDLLPAIVRQCEAGRDAAGWRLAPQGEMPIGPGQTLSEVGLFPGAVLVLIPPEPGTQEPTPPHPRRLGSMRERDYLRTLDAAIVAPRTPRSTVIAIAGAQPGAGATTVTALLAMAISALRDETVAAVDANPRSGALSHWLVPDGALAGDLYRSLFAREVTPELVSRALVPAGPRLSVLAAPVDPSMVRAAEDAHWERLIEHVHRLHHSTIVDCGTRRAADWADRVVLVNKFGQDQVARPGIRIPTVTVTNQAPRRRRISDSQVTLAIEPDAAARLKRRGFAWADAPASWQEAVRELAAVLLAGS